MPESTYIAHLTITRIDESGTENVAFVPVANIDFGAELLALLVADIKTAAHQLMVEHHAALRADNLVSSN